MIYDLQKASMWKRISAFLFDSIMLGFVAVLCAWLLSVVTGFDGHYDTLPERYAHYEEAYGVSFSQTLAEYEQMTAEELRTLDDAYAALAQDDTAVYSYNMVMQLTLLITTIGIFLGFLVMEFAIPMCFKNGQTLGKKVFGIGVMRVDGVKLSPLLLFARTVLGKATVETLLPVLIVVMIYFDYMGLLGTVLLLALALIQLGLLIATRYRTPIHDKLAQTVTVDFASQLIFDSPEALLEYKQRIHAEHANAPEQQ